MGTLGLADGDAVAESNLQRQIIHGASTLGVNKAVSAAARLRDLNAEVKTVVHSSPITPSNAGAIVADYDVVVGCLDSMESRYCLNDACVAAGRPLVEGGVIRFSGLATTIIPGKGPCYRCIFPESPGAPVMSPATAGVIGPAPGVIGSIQAAEALKIVLGIGQTLAGRLVLVDLLDGSFREVTVERSHDCPACGRL